MKTPTFNWRLRTALTGLGLMLVAAIVGAVGYSFTALFILIGLSACGAVFGYGGVLVALAIFSKEDL